MIETIGIVSCSKKKFNIVATAEMVYSASPTFVRNVNYLRTMGIQQIFVLSALYGLIPTDRRIKVYNKYLGDLDQNDMDKLRAKVGRQFRRLKANKIIALLSSQYKQLLPPSSCIEFLKTSDNGLVIGFYEGVPITHLIRWMGSKGWSRTEAIRSLSKLGLVFSHKTVGRQLRLGGKGIKVPELESTIQDKLTTSLQPKYGFFR